MDADAVLGIGQGLQCISPSTENLPEFESAVRLLLCDLWATSERWGTQREVESLLDSTWTGGLLQRMKNHFNALQVRQQIQREFQDPIRTKKRREEKMLVKQEKHRQRLALKNERDQVWREKRNANDNL